MTSQSVERQHMPIFRILRRWVTRPGLTNRLGVALTIAALVSGVLTYGALTATSSLGNDPRTIFWLLNIDFVLLLMLCVLIVRRIVDLWTRRRRQIAGSRLHVRLVFIFSIVAAAPAILMTIFSAVFLYFGVQSWFSDRVSTAVNESLAVAQAYLAEHHQVIRADTLAMANDLNRAAPKLMANPEAFARMVRTQSLLRNLSETIVFDSGGNIMARSGLTFSLEFTPIPEDALQQAQDGEVVLMTSDTEDRVRALVKLENYVDAYLFVGRMVEPGVLSHMETAEDAVREYTELEGARARLQLAITMIFIVVALLLMLAAVWFGLNFARQLVTPIANMILAAERVRAGDLTARVREEGIDGELGTLARTFNRMTSQLEGQRQELVEANRQLDQRRRFTETVLSGVSAGVFGVDGRGHVTLANKSAVDLMGVDDDDALVGQLLQDVFPEMGELLAQAAKRQGAQGQITMEREGKPKRTLLVRIVPDTESGKDGGSVVTFDDITELMSAQRKAAWADVARRIAHEIKNPLTPIQLSAERLKRKYLGQIEEDADTFSQCTDTIVRHVTDIGRMVDEFSSFARMPGPVMKQEKIKRLCHEMQILQKQAHPDISFVLNAPDDEIIVRCDARQMRQALTNLLQNAIDSVHARIETHEKPQGRIELAVAEEDGHVRISVTDNGIGLPQENRDRLDEPYFTNKRKGTGLGLAIVKKIMEDHEGRLVLDDAPDAADENARGCIATLQFPID